MISSYRLTFLLGCSLVLFCATAGCNQRSEFSTASQAGRADVAAMHPRYILCEGVLTEYEAEHPWFENWTEDGRIIHEDGKSPRAVFVIKTPAVLSGKKVGILFRATGAGVPPAPEPSDIGKAYSFAVPEDFFPKYETIDNDSIQDFTRLP